VRSPIVEPLFQPFRSEQEQECGDGDEWDEQKREHGTGVPRIRERSTTRGGRIAQRSRYIAE
jgi:hypothetical protein